MTGKLESTIKAEPASTRGKAMETLTSSLTSDEAQSPTKNNSTLFILTKGTSGRFDTVFSCFQLGLALVARGVECGVLLVDDGVYVVCGDKEASSKQPASSSRDLKDFVDLGGGLWALKESLRERSLAVNEIVKGVKMIATDETASILNSYRNILMF